MRKVMLFAAAAMMVPGLAIAQVAPADPMANQNTTTSAQSSMGDTANPMPGDTTSQQGDMMSNSASSSATGTAMSSSTDSAAPSSSAADAGMATGSSGTAAGSSTDMGGNAAMDATSPSAGMKTYPTCSRTVQDSCRNRGGK